jgi:phosphotriesterase-related protein
VVETARGPVEPEALGVTLVHEHVLNITAEIARDQPEMAWRPSRHAVIDSCVERLAELRSRGIGTIVDASAFGHGRDLPALAEIAMRSEVHIVVATGIYTYDALPFFFQFRPPGTSSQDDEMIELFVRDIREGVAGTGVKAGIIKCATDKAGVTPNIERVLRAVARAHRETGVPITTHTDVASRNGLDQQRIFAEEGVDLTRVIIGHSGDSQDLGYLKTLMDAGSLIGADRFGLYLPDWPTFEQRVDTVAALCADGYGDRIVLSHDASMYTDWYDPGMFAVEEWRATHISDAVLPALRERGVGDADITRMLVENPRRVLAPAEPY